MRSGEGWRERARIAACAAGVLAGCNGRIIDGDTAPDSGPSPGAQLVAAAADPDGGAFHAECQQFCDGTLDVVTCAQACECSQDCPCIDACLAFGNECGPDCPTLCGASPAGDAGAVAAAQQALATCSSQTATAVPVATGADLTALLAGRWLFCATTPSVPFAIGVEFAGSSYYDLYVGAGSQIVRGTASSTYGTASITQQGPGAFQLELQQAGGSGPVTTGGSTSGGVTATVGSDGAYEIFTPSLQASPRQLWLAPVLVDPGGPASNALVLVPAP
jgi:hypothetical protein